MAGVGLPPGVLEPAPPEPHPSDGPDVVNMDTLKRGFWGIFRMTPKQPGSSAGPFGSYQATCPFFPREEQKHGLQEDDPHRRPGDGGPIADVSEVDVLVHAGKGMQEAARALGEAL